MTTNEVVDTVNYSSHSILTSFRVILHHLTRQHEKLCSWMKVASFSSSILIVPFMAKLISTCFKVWNSRLTLNATFLDSQHMGASTSKWNESKEEKEMLFFSVFLLTNYNVWLNATRHFATHFKPLRHEKINKPADADVFFLVNAPFISILF